MSVSHSFIDDQKSMMSLRSFKTDFLRVNQLSPAHSKVGSLNLKFPTRSRQQISAGGKALNSHQILPTSKEYISSLPKKQLHNATNSSASELKKITGKLTLKKKTKPLSQVSSTKHKPNKFSSLSMLSKYNVSSKALVSKVNGPYATKCSGCTKKAPVLFNPESTAKRQFHFNPMLKQH